MIRVKRSRIISPDSFSQKLIIQPGLRAGMENRVKFFNELSCLRTGYNEA